MLLSYYGWCAAKGCREEATARLGISFGDTDFLMPLCADHLAHVKAEIEALEGHNLGVEVTHRDGS